MHQKHLHSALRFAAALGLAAFPACDDIGIELPKPIVDNPGDDVDRPLGETSFVSADGQNGQDSRDEDANAGGEFDGDAPPPSADEDGADDDRTVEEGDIYRVIPGGRIANLNAYRGLQIIDVNNVDDPKVVGRLQLAGHPVEMYVHNDNVFVLMNNWYGYYGSRDDIAVEQFYGGMVAAIDISDPTNPLLVDQKPVQGWISKSRLTKGSSGAALYVAAGGYDYWYDEGLGYSVWETKTYVKSFDVGAGTLVEKTALDLGGYVSDIQATTEALLVARNDWWSGNEGSTVTIIDIGDPDGVMVTGDEIVVAGYVESQFNMDLYNGVLRVVSGSTWSGTRTNHIQTFDATDFANLTLIDEETFGDEQSLFATLFVGNKAFFVTYQQVDPFHAFEITDEGDAIEHNEFIVSGWNDFFRAVNSAERLIGIGMNDENGTRKVAVSLYDITDLTNTNPMLARAEVEADYSWSEANWDHRAFSVVEDAVSIAAPDGTLETGLVLLPYNGWNTDWSTYTAAVQIFTFSGSTLTRRGLMVHGTPVRRSFLADDNLTANLSEAEISLFDTANPAEPVEHGRIELAPNYTDLLFFGDFAARVKNTRDYYYGWWGSAAELPSSSIEIISRALDPDQAPAIATIEVNSNAQIYQSGDALIAVTMTYSSTGADNEAIYDSVVEVYDLSDPTVPVLAKSFETDRLSPSYGYGGYYYDCWDCYGWGTYGQPSEDVFSVDGGLAFLERIWKSESVGTTHSCNTYVNMPSTCNDDNECVYYYGSTNCSSLNGAPMTCTENGFYRCTYTNDGNDWECNEVSSDDVATETSCYDYEQYRYWQKFEVETLDLRDLGDAHLGSTVALGENNEGASAVGSDDGVWLSYKRPETIAGSALPYVRYYVRKLSLANPESPTLGVEVNVPGQLLAVNGNILFTRDFLWGENIVETSLNRVRLSGNLAYLEGIHTFHDAIVQDVKLDGAGRLLVAHRVAWQVSQDYDEQTRLSILDGTQLSLPLVSETAVDSWATLKGGVAGRALFQVPGGLLVMNLDNPQAPYASAYFPTRGWPWRFLIDGDEVIAPAGRYGIYSFDLDAFNLLPIVAQ
jgi:hypothetical protein